MFVSLYDVNTNRVGTRVYDGGSLSFGRQRLVIEFTTEDESADRDSDGLGWWAESIIGTSDTDADSDDDGVGDGSELKQSLNPLDGIAYPSGIIGNAQPSGEVKDITVEGDLNNASRGNGVPSHRFTRIGNRRCFSVHQPQFAGRNRPSGQRDRCGGRYRKAKLLMWRPGLRACITSMCPIR